MRSRSSSCWGLLAAVALLGLPSTAGAVVTHFDPVISGQATPTFTLEIYDVETGKVEKRKEVEKRGGFALDLDPGRTYGARTADGTLLIPSFRAGETVRFDIPRRFLATGAGAISSRGGGLTFSTHAGFGGLGQYARGEATASFAPAGEGSRTGDFTTGTWNVGGEVMAPSCGCSPFDPRPFFGAGYMGSFDSTSTIQSAGEEGVTGLISLRGKMKSDWYTGLGVQFSLPCGDREVRLRPSFVYGQERIALRGRIDEIAFNPDWLFDETKTRTFHYIGPHLTVEVPLLKNHALELSAYAGVGGKFFVGDRSHDIAVTGAGGTADFEFRKKHGIEGGAGLKLSFDTGIRF